MVIPSMDRISTLRRKEGTIAWDEKTETEGPPDHKGGSMPDGSHPQGTNPSKKRWKTKDSRRQGWRKEHPRLPSEGMVLQDAIVAILDPFILTVTTTGTRGTIHTVANTWSCTDTKHIRARARPSRTNRTGGHGTCMVGFGGERSIHSSIRPWMQWTMDVRTEDGA